MLLKDEIKFPPTPPQFEPYGTYKELDCALNHGRSLFAAKRAANSEQLLIDNSDDFTRKLILKAVDLRRADVVRFMVERGADLNHVWEVTTTAADTEVVQRRGNNAPAPVPAAAPMDRKGR